jgi:hypothetical protein
LISTLAGRAGMLAVIMLLAMIAGRLLGIRPGNLVQPHVPRTKEIAMTVLERAARLEFRSPPCATWAPFTTSWC